MSIHKTRPDYVRNRGDSYLSLPDGKMMGVYDHTGTLMAESYEFDGSWAGDFPDDVLACHVS